MHNWKQQRSIQVEQERNDLQSGNGSDSLSADKVFAFSCPYLGMLEDSDTSLAFPDVANHCFRVKSPATVDLSHQDTYCLTDRHPDCHVFQKAIITAAVPEVESADLEPKEEQKRRVSRYALPLILVLILLAAIVWWPAPGSNIQEALVFGDQAQEGTREETSLTGDIAPEPVSQTSPVEGESSSIIKATAPAVSLRESPTQNEEEGATTSNNEVEIAAGDEGAQTQAPPEAGNRANPAVKAQAAGATGTTVRSQAETTESGESPAESPETETITLVQPAPSIESDASAEAEIQSPESSTSALEPSIETASVDEEAPSANIQDAAVTSASEEVEQTAETEEASASISIADLPIISADLATVATPPVESTDSGSRNEQVIFVGPGLDTSIALSDSPDSDAALLVRLSPNSNGDLITLINQREAVTLLGRDSNYLWLKIRLDSGEEGWVSAVESQSGLAVSSLPEVNEAAAADTAGEETAISAPEPIAISSPIIKSAFVDAGALNLRAGPGVEFEPITIINSGELVGLLGRLSSGPWVRIRLDNGVEGWVNSLLLTQGN
jgi:hypothetical protein